jgi:hypothetical protein
MTNDVRWSVIIDWDGQSSETLIVEGVNIAGGGVLRLQLPGNKTLFVSSFRSAYIEQVMD